MAYGTFGDIRALLHEGPSKGTWEKLCAEVRLWREPELSQVVFPYVLTHLEHWPDEVRVVRTSWAKDLLRGRSKGAHFTALARTLHIDDLSPTPEQWDNLTCLDWRSLRHLYIRGGAPHLRRWLLEPKDALFERLQTLSLHALGLSGCIGALCSQGALTNLERLELVGSTPSPDDLLELAVAPWPNLHTLTLRHLGRGQRRTPYGERLDSIDPLHEELDAPNLRSVDLGGLDCHADVLVEVLQARWLNAITHLALNTNGPSVGYNYRDNQRIVEALEHADLGALEHLDLYEGARTPIIQALARNTTIENLKSISAEDLLHVSSSRRRHMTMAIHMCHLPDAIKARW